MEKNAEQIGSELSRQVRGDVRIDVFNRIAFSTDASIYSIRPQCVVSPRDEADVVAVVRYAAQSRIPIAARGAGSGLAGESLTSGIVIDCRRYMNQIVQTAPDGSWVITEPGIVLDTLNQHLSKYKKKIGPDPSSSNRAVVGGVVANNATGAHSLQYGYIAKYVRRVRGVLYDGSVFELTSAMRPQDIANPVLRHIVSQCIALLGGQSELIAKVQPKTHRNRCGYSIEGICQDGQIDLARLMAGSEGTLAVFTEIELETVDVPTAAGLVQFEFETFAAMAKAVPVIVQTGASACELMDKELIKMALDAMPHYRDILPANCIATLLVEQVGDDAAQVSQKLAATVGAVGTLSQAAMTVLDKAVQQKLWKSRKDAVPLLNRQKGLRHPVAFVEDTSVEPARLDEYIAGLEQICRRHQIPAAFYGHAGDGELHLRPYLDLTNPDDIRRMRQIADEVFELAWSLGGTISGEHADGLVRAAFIERQYSKEYYELLCGIKRIFDPVGILNPGKIINTDPEAMEKNLRPAALAGAKGYRTELTIGAENLRCEIEQCNGCGVCLAGGQGRMCPVFRAAGEELASTRGKANLLANWHTAIEDGQADKFKDILSLCINCKMCTLECPAGVDMSRLIVEARAQIAKYSGFTITEYALSENRLMSVLASAFAPLSNRIMQIGLVRLLLEKTLGFDRSRSFPSFERGSFMHKAKAYLSQLPPIPDPSDKAVYFVDSFARYNDHSLGLSVLKVLRSFNVDVVLPPQRPAPMPAFVYGNIDKARRDMEYNIGQLLPWVQKGYKILCSEPSAAMFLRDELSLLFKSEQAEQISAAAVELMDYLNQPGKQFQLIKPLDYKKIYYHAPCHLRSFNGAKDTLELFGRLGAQVSDIAGGCCGLAGTAGMQKKNRTLCDAVGQELKAKIDLLNPDIIVTECAACKMQIEHLTGCTVIHPIKLLADSL